MKLPAAKVALNKRLSLPDKVFASHSTSVNTTASAPPAPQSTPVFTDDPLVAGVTPIKAIHIAELRDAVNQLRARAGLSAATWPDNPLTAGVTTIKAAHITELRTRPNEARTALGLSNPADTDPTLSAGSTTIKAVYIQELRES